MKTFFTLLFGGLITVSAFASDVTLTFSGNNNYRILIDGRSVNSNYTNNTIRVSNLRPGQHSIQVYKIKTNRGWNNNNNSNGAEYSSTFLLRPQYDLFINIDKRGRLQMEERRNNEYNRNNGNGGYGRNDRDDNYGRNDRDDHYGRNGHEGTIGNGGYGNGTNNNGYNRALDDASFNRLVQKIRSQWFGKMGAAKDAVNSNYFTTYQVREVLQIFSSENDRLELAMLAYRKTVDGQNYRQLYDMFSYNGQTQLDRYIRDPR